MTGGIKIKRKLFRLVGLLFPSLYALGDRLVPGAGWWLTCGILMLFLGIMFTLESIRFRKPGVNRWLFRRFEGYTKQKEVDRTSSTTFFLLACLFTLLLFSKSIAIASMLMLVFGDPVAEIIGKRWGRTPLFGKSLEGTIAGFVACLLVTAPLALGGMLGFSILLLGALAATLFELLPVRIDDNFTIPLGAGSAMTLAQVLLMGAPEIEVSPLFRLISG